MTTPGDDSTPSVIIERFDSSVLIDIWLAGFISGVSSLALTLNGGKVADADIAGDKFAKRMRDDPAAMETVRREVLELVRGIEGRPQTLRIPAAAVLNPNEQGGNE
ncbi:hypothetical protein R2360_00120 [Mycobacteroides chelonae]|uniref:hypothetical protein n=1 Tax=Mycobacteroides abscessus TaxID=36809 RepID=UPI000927E087|nr:hypothetical protein [Mycobacteroides abscessus]MEC4838142.1 hypothetical protein [Mycobacteroides chelonae]MEC4845863.1 hypothetical protein [Mycobacteroides chelonae]MEC4846136.1 hypothetical protein [Mycobacteroides chelonae]MEC4846162.1 hypothetical protein [Mycobacteroides chelonae]SII85975.1 Uncharacterised protein [Mycobacteroides abscessus subsp. abscessus]